MVVAAHHILFAAHIWVGQEGQERRGQFIARGRTLRRLRERGTLPGTLEYPTRNTIVQKGHGYIGHHLIAVAQVQAAITHKMADDGHLHAAPVANLSHSCLIAGGHGQYHALLRLREPYLPGLQAVVFQRHAIALHVHARLLTHLANR